MRLTRVHLYLLGGLMLAVLGPIVFSQQPDGGRGGRGGKRGGFDPASMWEKIAPGKDSINVNDVVLPPEMQFFADRIKQRMNEFLQKKGITNGVMTKALYLESSEERMRGSGGRGGPPPGGPPSTPPAATTSAPAEPVDPKVEAARIEEEARQSFARMDVNKDGVIDREEASRSRTLAEFDRWDLNKDGKISIEEYIEAFKARRASQASSGGAVVTGAAAPPPEEDRRPVVYRVGKLPKSLPAWFAELDKDSDGQVGLYEWKEAGRPTLEFLSMDANGDGFLTVEEVLRFQKATNKDKQVASAPGSPASPTSTPGQGDEAPQSRFTQRGMGGPGGGPGGPGGSRGPRGNRGDRKGKGRPGPGSN